VDSLDDHIEGVAPGPRERSSTRKLPTLKLYKIGVKLDMTGQTAADARVRGRGARTARAPGSTWTRPSCRILEGRGDPDLAGGSAARRAGRSAAEAEQIGTDEETLLAMLRSFKERKLMRRFAAGDETTAARAYKANAMGVWAVAGRAARRDGPAGWPASALREPLLQATHVRRLAVLRVHDGGTATTPADCEQTIAAVQAETGVDDYALLWSIKEYKKTRRAPTFTDEWNDWRRAKPHTGRRVVTTSFKPRRLRKTPAPPEPGDDLLPRRPPAAARSTACPYLAEGSESRPSMIASSSLVWFGRQPAARRRSLATTHGWTR